MGIVYEADIKVLSDPAMRLLSALYDRPRIIFPFERKAADELKRQHMIERSQTGRKSFAMHATLPARLAISKERAMAKGIRGTAMAMKLDEAVDRFTGIVLDESRLIDRREFRRLMSTPAPAASSETSVDDPFAEGCPCAPCS